MRETVGPVDVIFAESGGAERNMMQLSDERCGKFTARPDQWSLRVRSITERKLPLTHSVRICAASETCQIAWELRQ